jgi:transcription initiation factor TFIIB
LVLALYPHSNAEDSCISQQGTPSLVKDGQEPIICPECHSTEITEDLESGEIVCRGCGFVVAERTERAGPEWGSTGGMEGLHPMGVGPPSTLRRPDMGLATTIAGVRGAEKLRTWQARTFYTSSQRRLGIGIRLVEAVAAKLDLGTLATDQAVLSYRKAAKLGYLKGRSRKVISAASVYLSCREYGIPRTLQAVARAADVDNLLLAKEYRKLVDLLGMKMAIVEPEKYVAKIASVLSVDEKIIRVAYSILRKAEKNGLTPGMNPRGLASGALYLANLSVKDHPSQVQLAKAAGVTSFTLRKRAHLLKKYLQNRSPLPVAARPANYATC